MTRTTSAPTGTPMTDSLATRQLLACAAVAGPLFVTVAGVQVLARDGFDLSRHPLSLLSLGEAGWIQIANFVITGVLYVVGAVGLRRAMGISRGSRWAPRLIGTFGVSLVMGGVFVADPADGFPAGTPAGQADPSWHGMLHSIAPALGFLALIAACFVFARYFAQCGDRTRAICSVVVGLSLFAPDALMGRDGFTIALAAAAALGWTWASYIAFHLSREHAR